MQLVHIPNPQHVATTADDAVDAEGCCFVRAASGQCKILRAASYLLHTPLGQPCHLLSSLHGCCVACCAPHSSIACLQSNQLRQLTQDSLDSYVAFFEEYREAGKNVSKVQGNLPLRSVRLLHESYCH